MPHNNISVKENTQQSEQTDSFVDILSTELSEFNVLEPASTDKKYFFDRAIILLVSENGQEGEILCNIGNDFLSRKLTLCCDTNDCKENIKSAVNHLNTGNNIFFSSSPDLHLDYALKVGHTTKGDILCLVTGNSSDKHTLRTNKTSIIPHLLSLTNRLKAGIQTHI